MTKTVSHENESTISLLRLLPRGLPKNRLLRWGAFALLILSCLETSRLLANYGALWGFFDSTFTDPLLLLPLLFRGFINRQILDHLVAAQQERSVIQRQLFVFSLVSTAWITAALTVLTIWPAFQLMTAQSVLKLGMVAWLGKCLAGLALMMPYLLPSESPRAKPWKIIAGKIGSFVTIWMVSPPILAWVINWMTPGSLIQPFTIGPLLNDLWVQTDGTARVQSLEWGFVLFWLTFLLWFTWRRCGAVLDDSLGGL